MFPLQPSIVEPQQRHHAEVQHDLPLGKPPQKFPVRRHRQPVSHGLVRVEYLVGRGRTGFRQVGGGLVGLLASLAPKRVQFSQLFKVWLSYF